MVEVSFDVGLKTISNILREVSKIESFSQKVERLDLYVHLMEEEMKKIDAFKRELPHCMYLLKDAIEVLKEESLQLKGKKMEEFISLKSDSGAKGSNDISDKKSWMSSVNLWSTPIQYENNFCTINKDSLSQLGPIRYQVEEGSGASHLNGCNFKNRGGAFVPYKKPFVMEKEEMILPGDGLSLSIPLTEIESDDSNVKEDCGVVKSKMQQPDHKKQRRCWSPELHKRFVDALEQLGGAQSATPKQIRDFMKVDGLTNDEVKSHLQKFRLHVRKTSTSSASLVDYSTFAQSGCSKMSRPLVAHSGSPPGPFPRGGGANKGASTSGGGSMEDEEDDKSESQNWKGRLLKNIEKRL